MSRSIKLLAKELNVPIIVGAQLNRTAASERPSAHMLRESGTVEQDADAIILLRRKEEDEEKRAKEDPMSIMMVAQFEKWRGGRAGYEADWIFNMTRNRFSELPPRSS